MASQGPVAWKGSVCVQGARDTAVIRIRSFWHNLEREVYSHCYTVKTMQGASAALDFLVCIWPFCEIYRKFSERAQILGKRRLFSMNTSVLPSLAAFHLSIESESMQPLVALTIQSSCLQTLKFWDFMYALLSLASMKVVKWTKCISRLCLSSLKYYKTVPWHLLSMWYH